MTSRDDLCINTIQCPIHMSGSLFDLAVESDIFDLRQFVAGKLSADLPCDRIHNTKRICLCKWILPVFKPVFYLLVFWTWRTKKLIEQFSVFIQIENFKKYMVHKMRKYTVQKTGKYTVHKMRKYTVHIMGKYRVQKIGEYTVHKWKIYGPQMKNIWSKKLENIRSIKWENIRSTKWENTRST